MDKKRLVILITSIVLIIIIITIILINFVFNKDKNSSNNSRVKDLHNQVDYVDVTLPSINGNNNLVRDEFEKTSNISEALQEPKVWMNLNFENFKVYSFRKDSSTIEFDIINRTETLIESNKFQLQLLGEDLEVLSVIDFEPVILPMSGQRHVTISVNGNIVNVKNINVDDINYKMELKEGK